MRYPNDFSRQRHRSTHQRLCRRRVALRSEASSLYARQADQPVHRHGVREAIQQDFDTPIKESFQVLISNLERATSEARSVMREVGKESRFQTWKWISIMILCGVILGAFGSFFFYNQVIGRIDERLDTIQQQIAPVAPVPETKPSNPLKGHHRP